MSEFENDGAQAPASETAVAETVSDTATSATETTTTETTSADRPRDEGGKFRTATMTDTMSSVWDKLHAPDKPAAEAPEQATAEGKENTGEKAGKDSAVQSADKEKDTQAAKPASDAPVSWTADMKAKLATLPPEFSDLQEYATKRDREQNEAINRAGQQVKGYEQALKSYEPLRAVLEQNKDVFARNNAIPPVEVLNRILAVETWLGKDAGSAIKGIAQAYKVDLRELAGQIAEGEASGAEVSRAEDPRVSTLQQELAQTQQVLRQVTSHLTAQQRSAVVANQTALARQIAKFAEGKPHFENVRRHMGALMAADETLSIDDAYEQATWARPDIRNAKLAEQRRTDEEKRNKDAAARTAAARNAAAVNHRSSTVTGASPKSMQDTLRSTADRLFA